MTTTPSKSITSPVAPTTDQGFKPRRITRERVPFVTDAPPGSTVYLAGTFNDWDETSLQLYDPENTGDFRADVPLLPGTYEYKFVINGEWVADVSCPRWTVNEHGTLNSIRQVS